VSPAPKAGPPVVSGSSGGTTGTRPRPPQRDHEKHEKRKRDHAKRKHDMPAKQYREYLDYLKAHHLGWSAGPERKPKPRGWSPDSIPACSARAVAEALRLGSGPVLSDGEVLALHEAAGGTESAPVTILAALRASPVVVLDAAASADGLRFVAPEQRGPLGLPLALVPGAPQFPSGAPVEAPGLPFVLKAGLAELVSVVAPAHAFIVGLGLPGGKPHAVTVGPDGTWWSWGEPFSPGDWPGLVIEEAWAVAA
jgi:hypothetical protein